MSVQKNTVLEWIRRLGNTSCLTNILAVYNMGPEVYDIITPDENQTQVYTHEYTSGEIDQNAFFIENSLAVLLTIIERGIKHGKLVFVPFKNNIRRRKSDYRVQLPLSAQTQQRYENLSQGWIIAL